MKPKMSKHKIISFVKSGIRLIGCGFGMYAFRPPFDWVGWRPAFFAFTFLFLAEILGIVEEFYEIPQGESYKAFSTRTMCTAEALKLGVWNDQYGGKKSRYDEDGGAKP